MSQMDLFDLPEQMTPPIVGRDEIDGETYNPDLDHERLSGQLRRVFELMRDGQCRTHRQIADVCQGSEAAVSARLRDLRKAKFGGHIVERVRVNGGLWRYSLKVRLDGKRTAA